MKRSEMLQILHDVMSGSYSGDDSPEYWRHAAKEVLLEIEKAGMLPPPTLTTTLGQWDYEMKLKTAELFKKHLAEQRFEIEGFEFKHDFTDAEIQELVEAEYGTSITQSVPELFRVIVKELLKMGIEFAKKDENEKAD